MSAETRLWNSGDAYERYMGRWSRRIAPLFLDWLAPPRQAAWLDVGCGTGELSAAILGQCAPARIVGVDTSDAFLELARSRIRDPRFETRSGNALALPSDDHAFDVAASALVLNFVGDSARMLAEMTRVVRPGGVVALYVWDYAGHMQIMRCFLDAAGETDARAREFDDGIKAPICRPAPLRRALAEAGLHGVDVRAIDIAAAFDNFEDYWMPFAGATGSAPRYLASLDDDAKQALKDKVRARLPTGPDGEILLAVRAWAAKGRVGGSARVGPAGLEPATKGL